MTQSGEMRDVPFLGNDLNDDLPSTGKPLDPADGPGKADAEIAEKTGENLDPAVRNNQPEYPARREAMDEIKS